MKAKTIKTVLRKKFDSFTNSIEDEKVKNLVKENSIITGGCIASMLLNEKINDYDIYFTNKETTQAVAEYYVNQFNKENNPKNKTGMKAPRPRVTHENGRVYIRVDSAGVAFESDEQDYHYFETLDPGDPRSVEYQEQVLEVFKSDKKKTDKKYRPIFMTCNAITLSDDIQLVIRFYGDPEEIHKNYDFVHCTNYWTSKNSYLSLNEQALTSLLEKDLKYVGSLYPVCSILRVRKFIERGWTITAGQLFKIMFQIGDLDLRDPQILQEQLVGVDVMYFNQLLQILRKENITLEKIDYSYISELIDKIF